MVESLAETQTVQSCRISDIHNGAHPRPPVLFSHPNEKFAGEFGSMLLIEVNDLHVLTKTQHEFASMRFIVAGRENKESF